VKLAFDEPAFFVVAGEFVHILETEVAFAYAVPCVAVEGVGVGVGVAWVNAGFVEPEAVLSEASVLPFPEVAEVHLVQHVPVGVRHGPFVVAEVPGCCPVVNVFVGHAVVDFFYVALEVGEILECCLGIDCRVGVLVEIVFAGGQQRAGGESHGSACEDCGYFEFHCFHVIRVRTSRRG
jgi:hypothetical protein